MKWVLFLFVAGTGFLGAAEPTSVPVGETVSSAGPLRELVSCMAREAGSGAGREGTVRPARRTGSGASRQAACRDGR